MVQVEMGQDHGTEIGKGESFIPKGRDGSRSHVDQEGLRALPDRDAGRPPTVSWNPGACSEEENLHVGDGMGPLQLPQLGFVCFRAGRYIKDMDVLLALSPTRDAPNVAENLRRFAEKGTIHILYVLDGRFPESVSTWLLYLGFMGEAPSQEVRAVITEELRERAKERLKELQEELTSQGFSVTTELREGPFFEVLREVYQRVQPKAVWVPRERGAIFGNRESPPPLPFEIHWIG